MSAVHTDVREVYNSLRAAASPVAFYRNAVGDTILTVPALRALHAIYGDRLRLVCGENDLSLGFSEFNYESIVKIVTHWDGKGYHFDAAKLANDIGRCDVFLSLVVWTTASVLDLIGYLAPCRTVGWCPQFDKVIQFEPHEHAVDSAFSVAQLIEPSLKVEDFSAPPVFPAYAECAARNLRALFPVGYRVLAVHTDTKPEKMWPVEWFAEVVHNFLQFHPDFIVVVVGSVPQPIKVGSCSSRVYECFGLPLPLSCALVALADLFVGIDSCMLHVADLNRVPVLALFGPTSHKRWGPRFTQGEVVAGKSTMLSIKTTHVIEALDRVATLSLTNCRSQRISSVSL